MAEDRFAHDRFLVEQLIRPMVNPYQVTLWQWTGRSSST
jgi:hypothetical protein